MSEAPGQTVCLFVESRGRRCTAAPRGHAALRLRRHVRPTRATEKTPWLEIPSGRIATLHSQTGSLPWISGSCDSFDHALGMVETIRYGHRRYLVLVLREPDEFRINGLVASRINLLCAGDVVDLGGHQLHVSLRNIPYVGPPRSEDLGVSCGYCRLKISDSPGMRIYACPACGNIMHDQTDEVEQLHRLECTTLAACCHHCRSPVTRERGFVNVPDFVT